MRPLGAVSALSPRWSATCVRTACHSGRRGQGLGGLSNQGWQGGAEARRHCGWESAVPDSEGAGPGEEPIRTQGPGAWSNQGGGWARSRGESLAARLPCVGEHLPRSASSSVSRPGSRRRCLDAGTVRSGLRDGECAGSGVAPRSWFQPAGAGWRGPRPRCRRPWGPDLSLCPRLGVERQRLVPSSSSRSPPGSPLGGGPKRG